MATKKTPESTAVAVKSKGQTLADVSREVAERNAHALVGTKSRGAAKLAAFQRMLDTPYISGQFAAEQEAIVTVLNVAPGQVEKFDKPGSGEMVDQWIYLVALQKDLEYTNKSGEFISYSAGDTVLLGLTRNGVRDRFASIIQEGLADGEEFVDLLVTTVPAKRAGYSPAVTFRQLGLD